MFPLHSTFTSTPSSILPHPNVNINESTPLNNANRDTLVSTGPDHTVSSLHFGPEGTSALFLLATAWSKDALLWEIASTGQSVLKARVVYSAPLLASSFASPNEPHHVFLSSVDGKVLDWNFHNNSLNAVGQHGAGVKDIAFSAELNLLISSSWDRTVKYWDTRQPNSAMTVQLAERCYAMDVRGFIQVLATADKKLNVYDLRKANTPFRAPWDSPLKAQLRSIALFPDSTRFAVGSIEGRVSIQFVLERDKAKCFAFKCHRDLNGTDAYSVNVTTFHSQSGTLATAGSDGTYSFWDIDSKQRLKSSEKVNNSITAACYNSSGTILAYAVGYDWVRGIEFYDRLKQPNTVLIHSVQGTECRKKNDVRSHY